VPQPNEEVVVKEVDDEIYICSADGETMYTITDVGADIWRACDGVNTVGDIAELLLAAYDVNGETVAEDLESYLSDLAEKKLIRFQ
jgi:hypothetical protein